MKKKSLKGLIFLAILISGCASTERFIEPLCVNPIPVLAALTVAEQQMIKDYDPDLLFRIANNQLLLRDHIFLTERIIAAHNEQFEAECY